jgi:hypothetical protein
MASIPINCLTLLGTVSTVPTAIQLSLIQTNDTPTLLLDPFDVLGMGSGEDVTQDIGPHLVMVVNGHRFGRNQGLGVVQ